MSINHCNNRQTRMPFRAIVAVGAIIFVAGGLVACRTPDKAATFGQSVWGDFRETKSCMDAYKYVILVRVYADYWEDRGPHKYSFHHFRSTVVRAYKGDWQTSEKLSFVHGVDAPAKSVVNALAGKLLYVFTNERTGSELSLETGEFLGYDPEIDRQLRLVFSTAKDPISQSPFP